MESARCKAFMYAADTGSFTKAAERLNYTPSGVSQLVGALENETGLTLLRRTRKGVTLTPDGEILLPAVREFLEKENRIYELAAEVKGLLVGSVTIAAYSSISGRWCCYPGRWALRGGPGRSSDCRLAVWKGSGRK